MLKTPVYRKSYYLTQLHFGNKETANNLGNFDSVPTQKKKKSRVNSKISPPISVPCINVVSSIPEAVISTAYSPFVK